MTVMLARLHAPPYCGTNTAIFKIENGIEDYFCAQIAGYPNPTPGEVRVPNPQGGTLAYSAFDQQASDPTLFWRKNRKE